MLADQCASIKDPQAAPIIADRQSAPAVAARQLVVVAFVDDCALGVDGSCDDSLDREHVGPQLNEQRLFGGEPFVHELSMGTVPARVRFSQPRFELSIGIGEIVECATGKKRAPHKADRALHFALGFRAVGASALWRKAVATSEVGKRPLPDRFAFRITSGGDRFILSYNISAGTPPKSTNASWCSRCNELSSMLVVKRAKVWRE